MKKKLSKFKSKTSKIFRSITKSCWNSYSKYIRTRLNLFQNRNKHNRQLEIGPGVDKIRGFETLNVIGPDVDYILDATKKLPFKDGTFQLVYASHILEHVPWYRLEIIIKEWGRIISSGGYLEIWVPNGLEISKVFVEAEEGRENQIHLDGWYRFNKEKDPCVWANGRIFSYGDGTGKKNNPNWHFSLFSPRYLKQLIERAGFEDVEFMDREEVRGYDHGWINLGVRGRKC